MQGNCSNKKKAISKNTGLIDLVFSWSVEDILNEDLHKTQVEKIPESFQSVHHYFGSFLFPLLEETRAELSSSLEVISRAPFAELIFAEEAKPRGTLLYNVNVDYWRNRFFNIGKESYRTLPGDIFVVSDYKPEAVSDLQLPGRTWALAWVRNVIENGNSSSVDGTKDGHFKLKISKDIGVGKQKTLYLIFLMNITTNNRIWNSLHLSGNVNIIKEVLYTNSMGEEICSQCSVYNNAVCAEKLGSRLSSALNESQRAAILCSLCKMHCNHKSSVELIWGPPGTGKTKTVSMLLWTILVMNYRVLTCASTNVAITEVASRVLKLVKESSKTNTVKGALSYSLGDLLLFGNKDRLRVDSDLEEIYLDYRVNRLVECFGPLTGWKHCFSSMIKFFEDCVPQYRTFLENESRKDERSRKNNKREAKSFLGFARESFTSTALPLQRCVQTLATHMPKSFVLEHNFQTMAILVDLLGSFENLLSQVDLDSEVLMDLFSIPITVQVSPYAVAYTSSFLYLRRQCLSVLRTLQSSLDHLKLPSVVNKAVIEKFCFQRASLIFCTASSSHKLHSVKMVPVNLLVVDEAAQLKECELVIPLQLPGIRHAVLIGDEFQLPATVKSKVSDEVGFGRSLFERLSVLGHSKHVLKIQYRMHPSISCFPNSRFYHNKILNAPNVKSINYVKRYLPGPMFGPYSFINVSGGKEELDDAGHSRKNMVEVAVVIKIVQKLYEAYRGSKLKLSIGVVSPYTAQVMAIQEKLARKYEKLDGFALKVKSIDGFQGGEEDIIIISTVRSNSSGSIGFISSPQRTNVALTRARHCLWILGNGTTLGNNMTIWEAVVNNARDRGCFHNADDDKVLAKAIIDAKEELVEVDDLLNGDSKLYKRSRWKVLFSDNFRKSFKKLKSSHIKKPVIILLLRLSIGWRPKKRNESCVYESFSQILKQFRVAGLHIVCTIDIEKDLKYFQVLKVWDILPAKEVPMLLTCLDSIFRIYTDDFLHYCKKKCLEGELEVPMSWDASHEIVRCKNLSKLEFMSILSAPDVDEGSALKNSSVIEGLLSMKFYSLTYQVVSHLLSDNIFEDLDLPYQVSDQELDIILFPSSIFIVGRPGEGKTTILTTKLLQRERQNYLSQGLTEVQTNFSDVSLKDNNCDGMKKVERTSLRQIFITVTPKLCVAVKQQLFHLKRSLSGGNFLAKSSSIDMHDIDDTTQFVDIPDSFIDIPLKAYPLVVTFQKFLMMLDGSVGESYFKRFHMVGELFSCKSRQLRSIALYTFIKTKEVNCDRFISSYWPKFGIQLTKKLDAFTVFTEIISHIKGGLKALEACDGKLSREDYVIQPKGLVSALSRKRRERIYNIYLDYEKRKAENDEFDMADLVIYLHNQLKDKKYEGAEMDFVYIDEVQRLTMSQIALLKYTCKNVDKGFVFSGDTAEIITRGFDFRFQDVQSMFYKKFVLESIDENDKGTKIRQISDILHLSQNCHSHVGLLRLAQSVMDLLFRFFPLSTDILCPEKCHSSLGNEESPILLEPRKGETVIKAIFGNSRNVGKSSVGFGAEQVILVRNDFARKEITDHIGKQALILTIRECQGLEFQDVLLYNFFSSSPFKKQWRVIYEYMKEQDMLDVTSPRSYPNLNKAKYIGLCSELKLLYVAVTHSRQRLWICEDIEDLSKPMFDYWKKLNIVQVRQLDDSLVHAMQVASSKEEWISQGIKLYCEGSYGMASICFERAGDTNREIWAKAAGLRTAANSMHGSNPEMACTALREAADIFNTLGKAESAAHCLIELKEYEKAAAIYLETYGESRLEDAGDCFFLAKCYKLAAEVYAKGNHFSKFLSVCTSAKLFDMGLQFIQQLKQHDISDDRMTKISLAVEDIKPIFLEQGARHYHDLQDNRTMMKFVRAFHSMDSRRAFLKALSCCDDLLLLEKESGNFTEDGAITNKKGDILVEVDLLEKAGHFKDASMLILSYVIANSLWESGNKGWPLKQFKRKEKLLLKAKLLSKNDSDGFHECVCAEANILSGNESTLFEMLQNLTTSQRHESLRGVILSARRILDAHLGSKTSTYYWEDKMVTDLIKHSEEAISKNRVSAKTLVYFWNFWKEKIMNLLRYLIVPTKQNCSDYMSYEEFSLNYLGVRKQFDNQIFIYLLVNPDTYWARTITEGSVQRSGNLVSMDEQQFVTAARSFWCSEVLSVGMKVLDTLRALHILSVKNSLSVLCRCITAIHIFEVTNFLTGSKCLESSIDNNTVQSLFDMGLQSIMYWRQNENPDLCVVYGSKETCDIVHNFLEKCALHYHDLQDNRTMMKFVRAFHSMDSKRLFLRNLDCYDELLLLEEESGNFMEAITIARLKGDLLLEVDLLQKAGQFKEAASLVLFYVLANSLWAPDSKGWPLKQFMQKEELLLKAQSLAKNCSDIFYENVCTEADILLDGESSLSQKKQNLSTSQRNNSLIGEILSARKILDAHLQTNILNYEWEDELVTDPSKHAESKISQNQFSIEMLHYFWNFWKEKIVVLIEYLELLETQNVNEYMDYEKFCLNYLGVRKHHLDQNTYQLLNSEAAWVGNTAVGSPQKDGSMNAQQFAVAAQSYWCSELHSLGMRVLETLSTLYTCSARNSFSLFRPSMAALHIFEVTKFLMDSKVLKSPTDIERLQKYIESSSERFLEVVFSIDWTKSMKENIIALRGTGVSREVVKEAISRIIDSKNGLTNGKIVRVVMLAFGSGKLPVGLYELIGKKFDANPSWQAFIDELKEHAIASELSEGSVARKNENPGQCSLIFWLHEALSTTFRASWREELNYISPDCFLYIVERHLILASYFQGCFYTSKSSFIEWLICEEWTTTSFSTSSASDTKKTLGDVHDFMASIVYMLLINKSDTVEWVRRSCVNVGEYYQLLVLRLVVLMCLLCVNSGKYFDMLYNLSAITDISSQLPVGFCDLLLNGRKKHSFVSVLAKALSQIENPLVIVNPGDHYQKSLCEDAIVISMKDVQHRDDILRVLFPQNLEDGQAHSGAVGFKTDSNRFSSSNCDQGKSAKMQSSLNYDRALGQDWRIPDDDGIFDSPKSPEDGYNRNVKLDKYIHFINSSVTQPSKNRSSNSKEENIFVEVNTMLDELKKLSPTLDGSDLEMKNTIATMRELPKKLQLRKLEERLSNNPTVQNHTNAADEECQTSIASGSQKKESGKKENIKTEESCSSKEGYTKVAPCKPKMVWETHTQMRKPEKEPLSNNPIVPNHTNAADEACQASIASGSQTKESGKKKNIKTEESSSSKEGYAKAVPCKLKMVWEIRTQMRKPEEEPLSNNPIVQEEHLSNNPIVQNHTNAADEACQASIALGSQTKESGKKKNIKTEESNSSKKGYTKAASCKPKMVWETRTQMRKPKEPLSNNSIVQNHTNAADEECEASIASGSQTKESGKKKNIKIEESSSSKEGCTKGAPCKPKMVWETRTQMRKPEEEPLSNNPIVQNHTNAVDEACQASIAFGSQMKESGKKKNIKTEESSNSKEGYTKATLCKPKMVWETHTQMRKPEKEPLSNNLIVQNHTNAADEACKASIASGSQTKESEKKKNIKTEESSSSKEGCTKAAACKPKMVWETRTQTRKLENEPLSNNSIVQNHTNAADERCQASIASGSQKKESGKKKNIKTEESSNSKEGNTKAAACKPKMVWEARSQMRKLEKEPLSNDPIVQDHKNAANEACQASIASGSQQKKSRTKKNIKTEESSNLNEANMKAAPCKPEMVWEPKDATAARTSKKPDAASGM